MLHVETGVYANSSHWILEQLTWVLEASYSDYYVRRLQTSQNNIGMSCLLSSNQTLLEQLHLYYCNELNDTSTMTCYLSNYVELFSK